MEEVQKAALAWFAYSLWKQASDSGNWKPALYQALAAAVLKSKKENLTLWQNNPHSGGYLKQKKMRPCYFKEDTELDRNLSGGKTLNKTQNPYLRSPVTGSHGTQCCLCIGQAAAELYIQPQIGFPKHQPRHCFYWFILLSSHCSDRMTKEPSVGILIYLMPADFQVE